MLRKTVVAAAIFNRCNNFKSRPINYQGRDGSRKAMISKIFAAALTPKIFHPIPANNTHFTVSAQVLSNINWVARHLKNVLNYIQA
jgi:hypothetical protein